MAKKQMKPEDWENVVKAISRHNGISYYALESELGEAFGDCFDDFEDFEMEVQLRALPIVKRDNLYFVCTDDIADRQSTKERR